MSDPPSFPPSGAVARAARMRGRGWLVALLAVAVVATAGGVVATRLIVSPREVAARSQAPPATIITAEVVSQRIERAVITRGRVSAVDVVKVGQSGLIPDDDEVPGGYGPGGDEPVGGGEGVLTGVFVEMGEEVAQGRVVVEIDGRPVIVLKGARAMYRDVKPGMDGPDVVQLQRSLKKMGHYSGSATGRFDVKTQRALRELYADQGYPAAATDGGDGSDATAIQSAKDAVEDAVTALAEVRRLRSDAQKTLADQLKAWEKARKKKKVKPAAEDPGPRPVYEGPSPAEVASAERAVARAREAEAHEQEFRGVVAPKAEIVFVPRLPASVTQVGTRVGYAPSSPLFTLTPAAMVLTAEVAEEQAGLLHEGGEAEVDLPDGPVTGTILEISPAQTPGQVVVEIATPEPLAFSLGGADVKVVFLAAATLGEVLAVPQGAISSDPTGELSVIVQAPDESLARVPIEVGVAGEDLVEVVPKSQGALGPGDKVVIGG